MAAKWDQCPTSSPRRPMMAASEAKRLPRNTSALVPTWVTAAERTLRVCQTALGIAMPTSTVGAKRYAAGGQA